VWGWDVIRIENRQHVVLSWVTRFLLLDPQQLVRLSVNSVQLLAGWGDGKTTETCAATQLQLLKPMTGFKVKDEYLS